jgi:hypothetical protein
LFSWFRLWKDRILETCTHSPIYNHSCSIFRNFWPEIRLALDRMLQYVVGYINFESGRNLVLNPRCEDMISVLYGGEISVNTCESFQIELYQTSLWLASFMAYKRAHASSCTVDKVACCLCVKPATKLLTWSWKQIVIVVIPTSAKKTSSTLHFTQSMPMFFPSTSRRRCKIIVFVML